MTKQVSLDEQKNLRLVNDQPIRILLAAEAFSNIGFLVFIYFYPSTFLGLFFTSKNKINSLTDHLLLWWASWLVVITGLMFAAVPSKYNTPTLTAGLVHIRRYLYFALLFSEIFLAGLIFSCDFRTTLATGVAVFFLLIAFARLFVLFIKQSWFGTVLIDDHREKNH